MHAVVNLHYVESEQSPVGHTDLVLDHNGTCNPAASGSVTEVDSSPIAIADSPLRTNPKRQAAVQAQQRWFGQFLPCLS